MNKNQNLVIVESPNKIKSIKKYLGDDYEVMASVGHIVSMPTTGFDRLGFDKETWTPDYKIDKSKKDVVDKLNEAAKIAKHVYVATDLDREGEAIAQNLVDFLKVKDKYNRITYNEITERAVKMAMENPHFINDDLVSAQISRRILDRVIGFKISKLMRRKITNAPSSPSAGRVQSIALKIVIEREKLINAFIPVEYYLLEGEVQDGVIAHYYNPDKDDTDLENKNWIKPSDIKEIMMGLSGVLEVIDIKRNKRNDAKLIPLKQAALYKKADSKIGMSAASVQSVAQRLYEGFDDGGLISYPRTDSTRLSTTFVSAAQEYISKEYGAEYVSDSIKGIAGAQDAHEAIRPTDASLTPDDAMDRYKDKGFGPREYKLYKLIYEHSLQAIMTVPKRELLRYELKDGNINFKMSSSKILFDGYYKLTGIPSTLNLPVYEKGEKVKVDKYNDMQKFTTPPPRYNGGSLIEKLDNIGVGRPSTFATTVRILSDREYVTLLGKALKPTEFGMIVYDKLIQGFKHIMNEGYTAEIENKLDEIAEGKIKRDDVLENFWVKFDEDYQEATEELKITKMMSVPAGIDCPKCGSQLIVRRNKRNGQRFFGCSAFPECKHAEPDPTEKRRVFNKFKKK